MIDFHCHYFQNINYNTPTVLIFDHTNIEQISHISNSYNFAGIHPQQTGKLKVTEIDEFIRKVEELIVNGRILGIGEIGIDKRFSSVPWQKEVFERQLALAKKYSIPVQIHNVKAWSEILLMVKNYQNLTYILHSFIGSKEIVDEWKKYDTYFSISAKSLKSKQFSYWISYIGSKILIESDADNINKIEKRSIQLELIRLELSKYLVNIDEVLVSNFKKLFN